MTYQNELPKGIDLKFLGKRTLQGAGFAFVLAVIFLSAFGFGTNMKLGTWTILALLTVTSAGTLGVIFYYFMNYILHLKGWKNTLANVIFLLGYLAILWLSLIAAFAATGLWD